MTSISFDWAADFYDETRGFPSGEMPHVANLLRDVGQLGAHSRILEVGIGTGRIALPLAPHVQAIYGVDLSRRMMERLRSKQRDEAIYLVQGDATRIPYASHSFDAVLVVHVFHLISEWQQAVAEVRRVLKPNGVLLLAGHNSHDPVRELFQQSGRNVRLKMGDVQSYLRESGWQGGDSVYVHEFDDSRPPARFLESVRQRQWSGLHTLSDEEITARADQFEATLRQHYTDLEQPVPIQGRFEVRRYV